MIDKRLDTHNGDAITDIIANAALGQIPGAKTFFVVGHNEQIAVGTSEVLWLPGGTINQTGIFPSTSQTVYVSSSSTADVGQKIKIDALLDDWSEKSFGVTLNGQNGIALPVPIRRINGMYNAGNTNLNGAVYAGFEASPALGIPALINTIDVIEAEDQINHNSSFTVPLGYVALVTEFAGGTPTNDSVIISGFFSNPETKVYKNGFHLSVYRSHVRQPINYYTVPAKTDIYMQAKAFTNNAQVIALLMGVLIPEQYYYSGN